MLLESFYYLIGHPYSQNINKRFSKIFSWCEMHTVILDDNSKPITYKQILTVV